MFKKSYQQQLLSTYYLTTKKFIKNNRLDLFGKAIVVIDKIQQQQGTLETIRQIDLSHNAITRIQNIGQFPNVELFNLSHNKISDINQVCRLQSLKKLRKLFLKGNPFVKEQPPPDALPFLLSIETDFEFFSQKILEKLEEIQEKHVQTECYYHYLQKIDIHAQLVNEFNMQENLVNPSLAIFPKIKKIFQHFYKDINVRKSVVAKIEKEDFRQNRLLAALQRQNQRIDNKRSEIIRNIYDKEEMLKNLRLMAPQRVRPRKTITRNLSNYNLNNCVAYTFNNSLRQSISNSNVLANQKRSIYYEENSRQAKRMGLSTFKNSLKVTNTSPTRKNLEHSLLRDNQNFQQNYFLMLTRINPVYHLLHSPLHSLKSHEKQLLIQNLSLHLKQKTKECLRLQKSCLENQAIKEQLINLQNHCKDITVQVKTQQQNYQNKIKKLNDICDQQGQRIQRLCAQLQQKRQQIRTINQMYQSTAQKKKGLSQSHEKLSQYDDWEEEIKQKIKLKIKKVYLNKLKQKATKWSQFLYNHKILQNFEKKETIYFVFIQLKNLTILRKKGVTLRKQLIRKEAINFINFLQQQSALNSQNLSVKKYLDTKRRRQFYKYFKIWILKQKKLINVFNAFRNNNNKKIKQKIFKALKLSWELRNQSQQAQYGLECRRYLLLKKYLRRWLIYIKIIDVKVAEIKIYVKDKKRIEALQRMYNQLIQHKTYQAKFSGLCMFLERYRKIFYFNMMSKSIVASLFQRKMKSMRITRTKQHKYINYFINTMRDKRIDKIITRKKQEKIKDQLRKIQLIQQQRIKYQKKKNSAAFKRILKLFYKKTVKKMLKRKQLQYSLSKKLAETKIRLFLMNINKFYIKQLKFKHKMYQIYTSDFYLSRINRFFKKFLSTKNKTIKNSTRDQIRRIQSFYRWKINILTEKVFAYRQKFEQLAPQIEDISARQRETNSQKILLMREMEDKELLIKEYQKKIGQYEYILQSKELKYAKLKDIYSDTLLNQELRGSGIDRIPERDSQTKSNYYDIPRFQYTKMSNYDYNPKIYEGRDKNNFSAFKRF